MGREELLAALRELSNRGHGAAGFKPLYVIEQEILAEFDRLNEIIKNQSSLINNMGKRGATLQSQLDKISLPIKTDGDVGHIRRTVIPLLREQCKDISAQTLERVLDYLNSQETKEKPARCEHENGGISYYSAVIKGVIKQWCADCKEWT